MDILVNILFYKSNRYIFFNEICFKRIFKQWSLSLVFLIKTLEYEPSYIGFSNLSFIEFSSIIDPSKEMTSFSSLLIKVRF